MKSSSSNLFGALKSPPANHRAMARSPTPGDLAETETPTFATTDEIFECLRHPQYQRQAAQELSRRAASDLQDRPAEQREAAFDMMYKTLSNMVSNQEKTDIRVGGLLALVALLESDYLTIETKWLSRFRHTVRQGMPTGNDRINKLSALVISKLALRSVGTTVDLVDFQAKQAFEWLTSGNTVEQQKSAIALLRELARNCPVQFHMHIGQFFDNIFAVVFSPNLQIREEAIKAFQAVLEVAAQRETKDTTDVYEPCFDKILLNLQQHPSPRGSSSASSFSGSASNLASIQTHAASVPLRDEQIHGALLALLEVLRISCQQLECAVYDAECVVGPESQRQLSLATHTAVMNSYRRKLQFVSFPLRRLMLLQHSSRYGHGSAGTGGHAKPQHKVEDFAEYWSCSTPGGASASAAYGDERKFYASAQCRAHIERHYTTLCAVTLHHKQNNNAAILATIANIVPRLATFHPEQFSTGYWPDAAGFLFSTGKRDRHLMFRTIGYYVTAVQDQILVELGSNCLALIEALKQAIVGVPGVGGGRDVGGGGSSRNRRSTASNTNINATAASGGEPRIIDTDVLLCLDLLARAVKSSAVDAEIKQLVFLLLTQSFIRPVIACIHDVVRHRPAIKHDVHEQLQKTLLILLSTKRSPATSSSSLMSLNNVSSGKDQRLNKSTENLLGGGGGMRSSTKSLTQKTGHLFGRRSVTAQGGGSSSSQYALADSSAAALAARRSPSYDHLASTGGPTGVVYQSPVVSSTDIVMALKTLGLFNFDNTDLKKFIDEIVDVYLDVDDARILGRSHSYVFESFTSYAATFNAAIRPVSESKHNGFSTACADKTTIDRHYSPVGRNSIYCVCYVPRRTRYSSCTAGTLSSLFLALNDTHFEIREVVIGLLGRLIDINPAYVMPALRKVIVQVIMEFEQSGVNRHREASGRLLLTTHFVSAGNDAHQCRPGIKSHLAKLDMHATTNTTTHSDVTVLYCINAVGELAEVTSIIGGHDVRECSQQLVDVCYNMLQDSSSASSSQAGQHHQNKHQSGGSSSGGTNAGQSGSGSGSLGQLSKREETLRTLGKIVSCSGCVMEPYGWHPLLLDRLLGIVRSDQSRVIRREAMRVLGLLGALDPYRHKVNMGEIDAESDVLSTGTSMAIATGVDEDESGAPLAAAVRHAVLPPAAGGDAVNRGEDLPNETLISLSSVNMEEYYPAVAIHYLLRILDDPTLIASHTRAVEIIVKIFRSLEAGRFRRYIYQVIPALLKVATYHDSERSFLLSQLSSIIMVVRHHVKPFMPSIVDAVRECWQQHGSVDLVVPTTRTTTGVVLRIPQSLSSSVIVSPSGGGGAGFSATGTVGNPRDIDKNIISVIECLVTALGTDFKPYVAELMSCYLKILGSDDPSVEHTQILLIESFQRYGPILQDYLHMLLPQLSRLANSSRTSLTLKSKFLETIDVLSKKLNFTDFASQIIHPIIKILQQTAAGGGVAENDTNAAGLSTLRESAINTLCGLIVQLDKRYLLLEPRVALVFGRLGIRSRRYERLVDELKVNSSLSAALHVPMSASSSAALGGNSLQRQQTHNQVQRTPSLNSSEEQQQQQDAAGRHNAFDASDMAAFSKITLKVDALRPLWLSVSQRRSALSKEEWTEWMKRFILAVIHESPSPALRACFTLAQGYQTLARELFNAAFVSCWSELADDDRAKLLDALGDVLAYSDTPTEITQTLLNLAEFMEHCERGPLPLDAKLLASVALRCRAYAKALHYVERDFQQAVSQRNSNSKESNSLSAPSSSSYYSTNTPSTDVMEKLITINQKLQQPEAASGVLDYALKQQQRQLQLHGVQRGLPYAAGSGGGVGEQHLKESWYERLHEWERALLAYEKRQETTTNTAAVSGSGSPDDVECMLGRMRCLEALGDWQHLYQLVQEKWPVSADDTQQRMSTIASSASWALGRWERFREFSEKISPSTVDAAIADSVYNISVTKDYREAQNAIDRARDLLDVDISALASESYSRAYSAMVVNQQLAELEEVMQYKLVPEREAAIKEIWWRRLLGSQRTIEDWQRILMVRGLVVQPKADIRPWLKFASMCRKQGRLSTAHHVLTGLMGFNAARLVVPTISQQQIGMPFQQQQQPLESLPSASKTLEGAEYYTAYAYLKLLWQSSDKKLEAFAQLKNFVVNAVCPRMAVNVVPSMSLPMTNISVGNVAVNGFSTNPSSSVAAAAASAAAATLSPQQALIDQQAQYNKLLAKCCLKLGSWAESLHGINEATIGETLQYCLAATQHDPTWYKAWHAWAVMNFEAVLYYKNKLHDTRLEIAAAAAQAQQQAVAAAGNMPMSITGGTQQQNGAGALRSVSGAPAVPDSDLGAGAAMGPQGDGAVDMNALRQSRSASALGTTMNQQHFVLSYPQRVSTRDQEVAKMTTYIRLYSVAAVKGFVQSITLAAQSPTNSSTLQDTLRLLSLWFDYGMYTEVYEALVDGIRCIHIDTWLQVIPQLIARIDTPRQLVAKLIHQLLTDIARHHPQALIYPLTVASKSAVVQRRNAANKILAFMCEQNAVLVKQALLVSEELIRVAISWQEMWHESLEDASRLYFGDHNVRGMFAVLEPLHELLESGAQTLKEMTFRDVFARELREAHDLCQRYQKTGRVQDLTAAWDLYYHVFRKISKQLPQITSLELKYVSPKLMACSNLELAVPGTYDPGRPIVQIVKVKQNVQVITSKQRPRKVCMIGSNGKEYNFLLKGHEDLRQDERVMQLFGLVNTLLVNTSETARRNLAIQRFAAIPLSQNSGLLSWVPHCDTLHSLIRDYRDKKKILLNIEHRIMLRMAPDYDHLTPMQKVEVFEHALNNTNGDDLARVLWLKSPTSEEWFERRTNFTRSLAVMSMVGYILGLGDRHPSNLMLHRLSGKILHIDFGDCFEVAMHREKFPEKVPFRLTRMLVNAMEVTGIEGNYRTTCENVMSVLRKNKDSVLAVLEAFVYDPLFNWRLLQNTRQRNNPLQRNAVPTNNNVVGAGPPQQPVGGGVVMQQQPLIVNPGVQQLQQPVHLPEQPQQQQNLALPPAAGHVNRGAILQVVGDVPPATAAAYDNADLSAGVAVNLPQIAAVNSMMMPPLAPLPPVIMPNVTVVADQFAHAGNIRLQQQQQQQLMYRGPAATPQQLMFQQQQAILMQQQQQQNQAMLEQMNESVNKKALAILNRVRDKLTGRDFPKDFDGVCDVSTQVELLIKQATSNENLSQAYVGWCPFW